MSKFKPRTVKTNSSIIATSVPGDGDEDPGKIRFIVPKFWEKNRSAVRHNRIQLYCNTVV